MYVLTYDLGCGLSRQNVVSKWECWTEIDGLYYQEGDNILHPLTVHYKYIDTKYIDILYCLLVATTIIIGAIFNSQDILWNLVTNLSKHLFR